MPDDHDFQIYEFAVGKMLKKGNSPTANFLPTSMYSPQMIPAQRRVMRTVVGKEAGDEIRIAAIQCRTELDRPL